MSTRRMLSLGALVVVLAVGIVVARSVLNDYYLSILNFVGISVILACSLNITNGFSGLFSLGHPGFMAIGGYVTAVLTLPVMRKNMFLPELPAFLLESAWPFFPALVTGGLFAALAAVVVGLPVLRLRGHYLAVATLGFIIIVQVLITNLDTWTRGPLGLNGLPSHTNLWWVWGWALLTLYVSFKLKFSSLGRGMLAIRENELAAECLGIRLAFTRILALAIGAFFAGVAGGLWAHLITAITPKSFSIILAFNLVVMVVIGGTGSITGSFLAAVGITALREALRPLEESLEMYGISEIILAFGLLLVLIYRPKGMFGSSEPRFLTPRL
jgi:branched-chain amino acid transport system permease protein